MSNPPGTGSEESGPEDGRDAGVQAYPQEVDHDPITEVIEIPADALRSESPAGFDDERRYTAPGFDAGWTQIIDRVPDAETDFMGAPTEVFSAGQRVRSAAPAAVAPGKPQRPSWFIPIMLLVAALAAAAVGGLILVKRTQSAKAAQENAVRSTIETFDAAVRKGDLAVLRDITCGQTKQTYVAYDDKAWADTYAKVSAAKQYPVVASVDEIVINGDHAEANVTSYMAFDPTTKSTRSFDLQRRDDQWKVCQSP